MGRKAKFTGNQVRSLAALVRKHGASRTAEILSADPGTADASLRPESVFPDAITVTVPTVCRYAKEQGVELQKGRRKAEA